MGVQTKACAFQQSRHLNDTQLLPPDLACPFCGSGRRQSVFKLQDNPQVLLLECAVCRAVSSSRVPTDETLITYYNDYYESLPSSDSCERITHDDSKRFSIHLANRVSKQLGRPHLRILDYGGGDGSISVWMAAQLLEKGFHKVDIVVVDYNKTTVSTQNERISITQKDNLEDNNCLYDVVIASGVIEHLPQPRDILVRLLNLMDVDGLFYARTPCMLPLIKLLKNFGIKMDFTFPGHIHDLGQAFWESYLRHAISCGDLILLESNPSIVETTFKRHFLRTLASYLFKAPWYLLGRRYTLVGGWEVFIKKTSRNKIEILQK